MATRHFHSESGDTDRVSLMLMVGILPGGNHRGIPEFALGVLHARHIGKNLKAGAKMAAEKENPPGLRVAGSNSIIQVQEVLRRQGHYIETAFRMERNIRHALMRRRYKQHRHALTFTLSPARTPASAPPGESNKRRRPGCSRR